jgi:glycine/D-amino acid oxidase-like deaminating enzyme
MYDFLIIGQGIAGSILAYTLLQQGKNVFVIDNSPPNLFTKATSKISTPQTDNLLFKHSEYLYPGLKKVLGDTFKPKVIGGLITPVTGKRFSKTWLADMLLPFSEQFYDALQKNLKTSFYTPVPVVRIFADTRQANDWDVRQADPSYTKWVDTAYHFENNQINYPYGYTVFKHGAVLDGAKMLYAFHTYFKKKAVIQRGDFKVDRIKIKKSFIETDQIAARQIIFCEGWRALYNPYFAWLPFLPAKGELLILKSSELNLKEVINRGIFIRPLGGDLYLSGSTYSWDDHTLAATEKARIEIETKLKNLIKTQFKTIEQLAGIRPTVKGRRPFIGRHPQHENVYIFNGLGTKGLLLAPYFARHLCDFLLHDKPLRADVDIRRFL